MNVAVRFGLASLLLAGACAATEPRIEDVRFSSEGAALAGSIAWPADTAPVAAVVFVHGSGPQTRDLGLARRFASRGIAALVYDKRGVGESGGRYEGAQSVTGMNIALLAADASAALDALAERTALARVATGFAGVSQAGWIVPLAAARTANADFLLLWSAPVCKVSEEDIYSKHTGDVDGPMRPSFATALAARSTPYRWPSFLGRDTDAAEDLAALHLAGLWIFGDHDGSIPVDLSRRNLALLRARGHRFDEHLIPGQGHDNLAASFDLAVDWLHARATATR